jgi:uncharacterized protein with PIN domain
MANRTGPQPDVQFCPVCRAPLRNVPRKEMASHGHPRADGTVSPDTHTYECTQPDCGNRFEINQRL